MTKYFKMRSDNYVDYGVKSGPKLSDDCSFLAGKIIDPAQLPPLVFEVNFPESEKVPHLLGGPVPLVSKTLINALADARVDNFQTFAAKVVNPSIGKEWPDYFAFNVIGALGAANLDHSEYDTLMEGDPEGVNMPLLAFRDITLDKDKLHGMALFRLAESPVALIVSETIFDSLVRNRPEDGWGIDLVEVDVK